MSSRHLKKVFGTDEVLKLEAGQEGEDEDDDEPIASTSKGKFNNFALLNQLSDTPSGNDNDDDNDEAAVADSEESGEGKSGGLNGEGGEVTTRKKRRRKKKKRVPADEEEESEASSKHALPKEVVEARIAAIKAKEKANSRDNLRRLEMERLFALDSKNLNPQMELKRIFGAKTINSGRTGGKYSQRRVTRLSRLVSPKEHWSSTSGTGISMSLIGGEDGISFFKFTHNEAYQDIQRKFMLAVDSLNPDNIVNLLTACPYHIDSRIQLSDLAKNAEDAQVAADLVEGAIHCMESSLDSRFSITSPTSRLEYRYQENRAFHILLFKHLLFVGQRACYRTALELCKRLYLLDPENDPLAVTLMIDFYALKAGEHTWLLNVYEFLEREKNLSQLPNWAYSVALAHFFMDRDAGQKKQQGKGVSKGQKTSFAAEKKPPMSFPAELFERPKQTADFRLQYALLMFPAVLLPLLDKCGVNCETRVSAHPYFNKESRGNAKPSTLKLLCDLYVWRTHHVWKEKEVIAWVERNVYEALAIVDGREPLIDDYEDMRRRRYHGTPRNILRHLILTDNKEHMGHVSSQLANEPILNYDPIPPTNTIDLYDYKRLAERGGGGSGSNSTPGFLSSLFRSLLTDLNAPQPTERELQRQLHGAEAEQEAGPANQAQNGLQQSVAHLLESMRDLLGNLRLAEARADEGGDADEDDDVNVEDMD